MTSSIILNYLSNRWLYQTSNSYGVNGDTLYDVIGKMAKIFRTSRQYFAQCSTNYTLSVLSVQWLPPLPPLARYTQLSIVSYLVSCCSEPSLVPENEAILGPAVITHSVSPTLCEVFYGQSYYGCTLYRRMSICEIYMSPTLNGSLVVTVFQML